METAIWVALIPTIPVTLVALGKGVAYFIDLFQKQHEATVEAKNTEIKAKDETIELRDEKIAALEKKVEELESKLKE